MVQLVLKRSIAAGLLLLTAACEDQPGRPELGQLDPVAVKPATSDKIKSEEFRTWAPSDRAAFLAGRVLAAGKLLEAGHAEAALAQLTGAEQRQSTVKDGALESLGFEPARLEAVIAALELDRPAEEIEPLLAGAESSLFAALAASDVPPKESVAFLMRLSAEAYERGVKYGEIIDAAAYQSAYGYAVAAREVVSPLDDAVYGALRLELDILALMWPAAGPVPERTPPPELRMSEQFARVKLALSALP